jgi:hypothetical protein
MLNRSGAIDQRCDLKLDLQNVLCPNSNLCTVNTLECTFDLILPFSVDRNFAAKHAHYQILVTLEH